MMACMTGKPEVLKVMLRQESQRRALLNDKVKVCQEEIKCLEIAAENGHT